MTSHVFTEDQKTMEWYIDGIPVAELKRRYEAHDELVEALDMAESYVCALGTDSEQYQVALVLNKETNHKMVKKGEVRNG